MSTAAERMRVMRERRRAGVVPVTVAVQIDRLALALTEERLLLQWDDQDRAAIETALQKMVDTWIAHIIGPAS